MRLTEYQHLVQALTTQRPDQTLGNPVLPW